MNSQVIYRKYIQKTTVGLTQTISKPSTSKIYTMIMHTLQYFCCQFKQQLFCIDWRQMSGTTNIEHLALLKFGISVAPQQRDEVLKLIKANPAYKDDFEKIKSSITTMTDENEFLDVIINSHSKIADIPENNKVIQFRDNTYQIRAINPEQITSLTQRAFFNSFNLERVVLNDQEEQNTRKRVNEFQKEEEKAGERQEKPQKQPKKNQNEEEDKCICGKNIPDCYWIQCSNQNKCRGSSWYHVECAGVTAKAEQIDKLDFTCEHCRPPAEEKQSESSQKRFKSN